MGEDLPVEVGNQNNGQTKWGKQNGGQLTAPVSVPHFSSARRAVQPYTDITSRPKTTCPILFSTEDGV
jgi:hypothetical protein